ncbi:DUF4355 domain-containing protein [Apilactobacillus micheneri]|uniref:DUF4355 domain-containing protein n=1 Tax=Apilactobacillus micheneri TaxID=1899430 RepID=A0ABY2YV24_9LACO|nr:DUF4355 domain-containing protein [Apilactobacillus micheneri]TPR23100.1 DUF4355 domain-containing protein [Apilactobacillus micheneri]TPR24418.1 DUF4355 domain-containing protein [Apilactobacillus micheneri]TPR29365.1 DUF4355 domain-containing protein [Apilactobacillus micheneri]TPR34572.1 DUF4355 domain-containing protein [Apilactobacillus micheneri]
MADPKNDPKKNPTGDGGGGTPPKPKTYSEEEMQKALKQITDLKAQHKQEIDGLNEKINGFDKRKEELIQKGVERGKMNAQQLAEQKLKDQRADLDNRSKELDEKVNSFNEKTALIETKSILADKKLPVSFAKYLTDLDEDTRNKNIEDFEKNFTAERDKAVQAGVEERIKGKKTPHSSTSTVVNTNDLTQEKWDALSMDEQNKIYINDPDTAKKFMR